MSTRVQFTLTHYALSSGKLIAAVRETFGPRLAKYANSAKDVTVDCSGDRFIRFLIARNAYGATNSFKDLNLQIIEPAEKPTLVVFD